MLDEQKYWERILGRLSDEFPELAEEADALIERVAEVCENKDMDMGADEDMEEEGVPSIKGGPRMKISLAEEDLEDY
mgnify:CR=1 FL=1